MMQHDPGVERWMQSSSLTRSDDDTLKKVDSASVATACESKIHLGKVLPPCKVQFCCLVTEACICQKNTDSLF